MALPASQPSAHGVMDETVEDLVRAHRAGVRAFLVRHVRDKQVVDDLVQETFLTAVDSFRGFRGEAGRFAWLLGIARHKALKHLRREAVRSGTRLDDVLAGWRAEQLAQDDLLEHERELLALNACLGELSGSAADVVAEYYQRGRSVPEIAQRLRRREGAVRMMLTRIRQSLRACIARKLGSGRA